MTEGDGQPGPATGAPALHRAARHAEHVRGLVDAEAVQVDQDDGEPLLDRQVGQGSFDLDRRLAFAEPVALLRRQLRGQRHGGAHGPPAGPVQARIDDHPVQPGRHLRLAAVRRGSPERRQEGVLQRVGGFLPIAQGPHRDGVQPIPVQPDQLLEGIGAARDVG